MRGAKGMVRINWLSVRRRQLVSRRMRVAIRRMSAPEAGRAMRRGSSLSAVARPMRMASIRPRSCWTKAREVSELIHLDSPLASATQPSRLWAHLAMTKGRLRGRRAGDEGGVEGLRAAFFEEADVDLEAAATEEANAFAVDCGEGVDHGDDDAFDSGGEDGVGAGRGFSPVAAGFEGDVEGGAAGFGPGVLEGVDFGVRAAEVTVVPFADDFAVADDERADHGVGFDAAEASFGEVEGAGHETDVCWGDIVHTAAGATRTRDLRFRKPPLYPTELRPQILSCTGFISIFHTLFSSVLTPVLTPATLKLTETRCRRRLREETHRLQPTKHALEAATGVSDTPRDTRRE